MLPLIRERGNARSKDTETGWIAGFCSRVCWRHQYVQRRSIETKRGDGAGGHACKVRDADEIVALRSRERAVDAQRRRGRPRHTDLIVPPLVTEQWPGYSDRKACRSTG